MLAGALSSCSGDGSGTAAPTSSSPAASIAPRTTTAAASAGPSPSAAHVRDPRSGISFDLPGRPRVVDQTGRVGDRATCRIRSWITTEGQRPIVQASVDIAAECDRPLDASALPWAGAWTTAGERKAGGRDVAMQQVRTHDLSDGSAVTDYVVTYTQVGAARQTSSWFVHVIRTPSALVIVQTLGFPFDASPLPAAPERHVHGAVISSLRLP